MIESERNVDVDEDVGSEDAPYREAEREKLTDIYSNMLSSIGLTGREIARLSGTRPQYISDIKRRQRPLSHDMFMRTLLGLYGEYKWLISGDLARDTERIIGLRPYIAGGKGVKGGKADSVPLPVFQRPFMGPKLMVDDWDGSFICVTSPVKEALKGMTNPYVLHLPFDDRFGRLRKGDYLVVNQVKNGVGNYVLLKSGWGVKLARRGDGAFADVENPELTYPFASGVLGVVSMLVMGAV